MDLEAVIGLEIHAQISTDTKMFCRCSNDSFEAAPNENTCPICMGFPGQLPVLNEDAVLKGVKAALALNCNINSVSKFDRKNYFYPDSPKGFQISQYDQPFSSNGFLDVEGKRISIDRIHLEDDAGKLTHVAGSSLVDFNRAGSPLMEIVSAPDLRSGNEAALYAREIQKILRYVGSSEADMEKGMMRFDASVSVRPKGEDKLYPRAEIKNLNSFKSLEKAIEYEIARQMDLWREGGPQSSATTLGWDDDKGVTFFMRDKEDSTDYRYFPEPDLPPLVLENDFVSNLKSDLPVLPSVKFKIYTEELGLNPDDSRLIAADFELSNFFDKVVELSGNSKLSCSLLTTVLLKYLNEDLHSIAQQSVTPEMLAKLVKLVDDGVISNNLAKGEVFELMYREGKDPEVIVEEKGLKQVTDTSLIEAVCTDVIAKFPSQVEEIRSGKDKLLGFLVGQVMKEMQGKGNPQLINELVRKLILG